MDEKLRRPTLQEILAAEPVAESTDNSLRGYIEVTPRALATLSLREQLTRWIGEPLRLAQAAKSAHLAMQAALTDALAGSAGIGAYDDKLRAKYLAYFEASHEGEATPPTGDRVMSFRELLARATSLPIEHIGRNLEVSPDEMEALDRLTFIRHHVEHPRPGFHFIQPLFIALTLPVAARLTLKLMDVRRHQYYDGEREIVEASVAAVTALCRDIGGPP